MRMNPWRLAALLLFVCGSRAFAATLPPVISSPLTAFGNVGRTFSYQITATRSPTSFNASGLPAGLGVNRTNGLISGTPISTGTSIVVISATNAGGTGTATAVFSIFAALPTAASPPDLGRARAYPVPFKPSGPDPAEGKPYSPGDAASGIIFDNLPAVVTLKIYTLDGRLAAQLGTSAGTGTIRWDVRNEDGRDVASGGYFAVISSPGQKSVVRRLLIIR